MNDKLRLDDKTIVKLAVAIATAIRLATDKGEHNGPLVNQVASLVEAINKMPHFEEIPD
jgi:hypothetical protein